MLVENVVSRAHPLTRLYLIWIRVTSGKNGFINTYDFALQGKQMNTKKRATKPKKVDLLELSESEKTHFLKEAKENLKQKLVEAKFWQSLAETERITINGQKVDFEDGALKGFTYEELTER